MVTPRLVFVLSPYQNAFFGEIAEVLLAELEAAGVPATRISEPGEHVVEDHDVFVLMPQHEYVALEGAAFVEDAAVAARTIGISAEQPHQPFFAQNADLGARLGAVLDFSASAVAAYRARGVLAEHLPFGYTPSWDRFRAGPAPSGPPRVLYMGNKRPRRLAVLATAAESLGRENARLLVSDNSSPNRRTGPAFVAGDDKRSLLSRTRLLVNIHQSEEHYFEWLRFSEAAHCGTPFLTETSTNAAPYVDGVHFESFEPAELSTRLDRLVNDDARLAELREAAYDQLRRRPLAAGVATLVETAVRLLAAPPPAKLPGRSRTEPLWGPRIDVAATLPTGDLRRPRLLGRKDVLIAPLGTQLFDGALARMRALLDDGHELVTGVVCGRDIDGEPTLEGVWPWETWRLRAGQHLGRVMLVRGDVSRAAAEWVAEPGFAGVPHAAIAAWVALHGGRGAHLPSPVGRVVGVPLDPSHALPGDVAAHLATLVAAHVG